MFDLQQPELYLDESSGACVFDGIVTDECAQGVHRAMLQSTVTVLGCSDEETAKHREVMLELDASDFAKHELGQAILRCAQSVSGRPMECYKVLANQMRFGAYTFGHQDAESDRVLSALYFVNTNWHHDWGGELVFFGHDGDAVSCVSSRPGRLVVFPASTLHRATPPTRACLDTRITISARFSPSADKALEDLVSVARA